MALLSTGTGDTEPAGTATSDQREAYGGWLRGGVRIRGSAGAAEVGIEIAGSLDGGLSGNTIRGEGSAYGIPNSTFGWMTGNYLIDAGTGNDSIVDTVGISAKAVTHQPVQEQASAILSLANPAWLRQMAQGPIKLWA